MLGRLPPTGEEMEDENATDEVSFDMRESKILDSKAMFSSEEMSEMSAPVIEGKVIAMDLF